MTLNHLKEAARQHIDQTAKVEYSPAGLSELDAALLHFHSHVTLEPLESWLDPITDKKSLSLHQQLLVTEFHLRNFKPSDTAALPQNVINALRQWIIDAILPTSIWAEKPPFSTASKLVLKSKDITRLKSLNVVGLRALSHLESLSPVSPKLLSITLVTCLASFTNPDDIWSSHEANSFAGEILAPIIFTISESPQTRFAFFTALLSERVKPLFNKSKNPAITPAGRKAIDPLHSNLVHMGDEETLHPWRYKDVYIMTVFQWVLQEIGVPRPPVCLAKTTPTTNQVPPLDPKHQGTTIQPYLPLVIPPLLALLDCPSPPIKARGCILLSTFLESCRPPLLHQTGLGSVFLDALFPALHFLPPLTPEPDSLLVLGATFPALLDLLRALHPGKAEREAKQKKLDQVLREGVFRGYALAGENVRVAEALTRQMTSIVHEMGSGCIKHLKSILPLLTTPLTSPFATSSPPLLHTALLALEAITQHAWPRVNYHKGEILTALVMLWVRIEQEEEEGGDIGGRLVGVRVQAKELARLVLGVLRGGDGGAGGDVEGLVKGLVGGDERLRGLFF